MLWQGPGLRTEDPPRAYNFAIASSAWVVTLAFASFVVHTLATWAASAASAALAA